MPPQEAVVSGGTLYVGGGDSGALVSAPVTPPRQRDPGTTGPVVDGLALAMSGGRVLVGDERLDVREVASLGATPEGMAA